MKFMLVMFLMSRKNNRLFQSASPLRTLPGTSASEKDKFWRENLQAELNSRHGHPWDLYKIRITDFIRGKKNIIFFINLVRKLLIRPVIKIKQAEITRKEAEMIANDQTYEAYVHN